MGLLHDGVRVLGHSHWGERTGTGTMGPVQSAAGEDLESTGDWLRDSDHQCWDAGQRCPVLPAEEEKEREDTRGEGGREGGTGGGDPESHKKSYCMR